MSARVVRAVGVPAGMLLLLATVACASSDATGAAPAAAVRTPRPTVAVLPTPTATPQPLPGAVRAAVEQAALDAGVPVGEVDVVGFQSKEWGNAALGCPQPGKFYAQVVTPGYVVLLQVDGAEREYHTDLGTRVVTCAGDGA